MSTPTFFFNTSFLRILVFLMSAFFFASCQKEESDQREAYLLEQKIPYFIVKKEIAFEEREFFGIITPFQKVDVLVKFEGMIDKIFVREGQKVKANQMLAQIDNDDLQIEFEKTQIELSEVNLEIALKEEEIRKKEESIEIQLLSNTQKKEEIAQKKQSYALKEEDVSLKEELLELEGISQKDLEKERLDLLAFKNDISKAQTDLEASEKGFQDKDLVREFGFVPEDWEEKMEKLKKINVKELFIEKNMLLQKKAKIQVSLKNLNRKIQESTIRSPLDGNVVIINFYEGEKATPDKAFFTIFRVDPLYLDASIPENHLPFIFPYQKARIFRGERGLVEAHVEIISPILNPKTRSGNIKILLQNSLEDFKIGEFLTFSLLSGEKKEILSIPLEAVMEKPSGEYEVLVVNENFFTQKKLIKISGKQENRWIIQEGLLEGTKVLENPFLFQEGQEIAQEKLYEKE